MKPVLLDTGVIVALLDRRERHHAACLEAVAELRRGLVTCEAVIAESCYLLRRIPGAPEAILKNVRAGIFQIPLQLSAAAAAVGDILHGYRDIPASLADACLIHLAGEIGSGDILTLDSDFDTYRWRRKRPFRRLPSSD